MNFKPSPTYEHWAQSMQAKMKEQRRQLQARDPAQVAEYAGANWNDSNGLRLAFFQTPLRVIVPEYAVVAEDDGEVHPMTQALVLTYLLTADGTPRAAEWIAFRELPDGLFYHQAFEGYSGGLLARTLGEDLDAFGRGAAAIGGTRLTGFGDAAYEFRVLPRLWLAMVYWLGDAEDGFPPKASVLFDRSAGHYMIVDGLAIIGGQLVRRIIRAAT